jgi:hypothetical protein
MALRQALDELVDTLEKKGASIRMYLKPGLSQPYIHSTLATIGIRPPKELLELYEWRNGVIDEISTPVHLFGEHQFISLEYAAEEYKEMIKNYHSHSLDMNQCFPFSSFQGDLCAIYCEDATISALVHPVINIYHGIALLYESIERMAETATAWFASGIYDVEPVDEVKQVAIRQKINSRVPYNPISL